MRKVSLVLGFAAALGLANFASAATLFTGNASAVFQTPTPSGGGVVYSGVGTNDFKMGSTPDQNEYKITGSAFSTNDATPFAVAGLFYHNGVTQIGSTVTSVPVNFTLTFTAPPGTPAQTFTFGFNFNITPNNANPQSNPANDDFLTIVNAQANQTFVVGGNTYTLYLLGFGPNAGSITNSFRLPESADTTSTLWAQLDQPGLGIGQSAPLPASAWSGLTAIAALGLYGVIRRRSLATA